MNDKLVLLFVDQYEKLLSEGKDGYLIIKFSVPLKLLSELYERLCIVDVQPIETIPEEEKLRYWNISKRFHTEQTTAVKGSKAAYILTLITNS